MNINKILKDYELKQISEYYDMIAESYINGQFKQQKKYFNKLSNEEKKDCLDYCLLFYFGSSSIDEFNNFTKSCFL